MSNKDDGGAAFPISRENEAWFNIGMTLRDYFAAQALVSMGQWCPGASINITLPEGLEARASWAYAQADAMLKERGR